MIARPVIPQRNPWRFYHRKHHTALKNAVIAWRVMVRLNSEAPHYLIRHTVWKDAVTVYYAITSVVLICYLKTMLGVRAPPV